VALQKIESRGPQPGERSEPEPLSNQPLGPEIGFVPSTSPEPSPFDPVPAGSDPRPLAPGPASEASLAPGPASEASLAPGPASEASLAPEIGFVLQPLPSRPPRP
jgi:hypothetical protein